jgi:NADH-quinone oxidoreductase subunit E
MLTSESLKRIDREIAKYPADQKQSAVMAALAIAQEQQGWLSSEAIECVANYLGMAPIAAYEVASFYNMYDLKPVGKYKLSVCTNLPCMLSGGVDAGEYLKKSWASAITKRRRRPDHAQGRRVHGRLRRCAGDDRQ